MAHEAVEETKQSIIHTYCLAEDVAADTVKTARIVKPKVGVDGNVELAVDGTALLAGVVHHPGCKNYFQAGEVVAIIRTGKVLIEAGAALPSGTPVTADAQGRAVAAAAGDYIIGYANSSATAAGEFVSVELNIGLL